jgi:hypothetical protein
MFQKVLSQIEVYTGDIEGIEIAREKIRCDIFESYVLDRRISDNLRDYAYQDYKVNFSKPLGWMHDYVRDHFNLYHKKNLILQKTWGNIYLPMETSFTRHQVEPLLLRDSPDYTYIYNVDVKENSCEFVIEYDDHRRANNTWHLPLRNNEFIIFPSTQRYFISKNKSDHLNVFVTSNCIYVT